MLANVRVQGQETQTKGSKSTENNVMETEKRTTRARLAWENGRLTAKGFEIRWPGIEKIWSLGILDCAWYRAVTLQQPSSKLAHRQTG